MEHNAAPTMDELRAKYLETVLNLRFIDDYFLSVALDDPATAKVLLDAILERPITVRRIETQHSEQILTGRGVRFDILVEDADGEFINVEVQRAKKGASVKRARYNAAMLDTSITLPGDRYNDLPSTYIIFITEHDPFGHGLQMYHIDRVIRELQQPCGDGQHIIYVNSSCQPDTPLGDIMHDFYCRRADDMRTPTLARRMATLKTNERKVDSMCQAIEEIYGKGMERGQERGQKTIVRHMLRVAGFSPEQVADCTGLPLAEVHRLANEKES